MTKDEFQDRYHRYMTRSMEEAQKEAAKVNAQAEGFTVAPQEFPGMGICLMLSTAIAFIKELGIVE